MDRCSLVGTWELEEGAAAPEFRLDAEGRVLRLQDPVVLCSPETSTDGCFIHLNCGPRPTLAMELLTNARHIEVYSVKVSTAPGGEKSTFWDYQSTNRGVRTTGPKEEARFRHDVRNISVSSSIDGFNLRLKLLSLKPNPQIAKIFDLVLPWQTAGDGPSAKRRQGSEARQDACQARPEAPTLEAADRRGPLNQTCDGPGPLELSVLEKSMERVSQVIIQSIGARLDTVDGRLSTIEARLTSQETLARQVLMSLVRPTASST